MGLLNRGMGWLSGRLDAAAGVPVVYSRAAVSVAVTAVVATAPDATADPVLKARAGNESSARDFLIAPTALGSLGWPKGGDTIAETVGGVAVLFVVRTGAGVRAWSWADPERTRLRVHTIQAV